MDNFRHPYLATSPQDFWHRWHISLSTWLRDYLFIPLGGSRSGLWFTARNLLITMLIGGLWHGANWTFIAWGAVHGTWLVAHRFLPKSGAQSHQSGWPAWWIKFGKQLGTFHLVCLTWLLFRCDSLQQAWDMLLRLGEDWSWTPFAAFSFGLGILLVGPLLLFEIWVERRGALLALTKTHWLVRSLVYLFILLSILYLAPNQASEFIYFQF
jgi:D-alanyl-lipoteichoic acid acyltransferase DltB (MBOAT superfamily)